MLRASMLRYWAPRMVGRGIVGVLFGVVAGVAFGACGNVGDQPIPAGTSDPKNVQNPDGARAMAVGALAQLQTTFFGYIQSSGVLSDELISQQRGSRQLTNDLSVDARILPEGARLNLNPLPTDNSYKDLHKVRVQSQEAISALVAYVPDSSARLRGALYAYQGYAEVMLADLFCSGVPLSRLNYQHDFTYAPSSTTAQVYAHAITLFDSALVLAKDSALVVGLASVGKGRALLALARYADAATAVVNVPVDFRYVVPASFNQNGNCFSNGLPGWCWGGDGVADGKGSNGRPYVTSGDPRTAVVDPAFGHTLDGTPLWAAAKYPSGGVDSVAIASGIEAQLIRAEAALQANDPASAFTILNSLRSHEAVTAGMPAMVDPGTTNARVDSLFAERAAWLFLSGIRQGDMRRLVRNYHRASASVYPTGGFPVIGLYGTNIDAPIPTAEFLNPLYRGCLSRD